MESSGQTSDMDQCKEESTVSVDIDSRVETAEDCQCKTGRKADSCKRHKQTVCLKCSAVKAYIHQTHKNNSADDSSLFHYDDSRFLLPPRRTYHGCCSLWWKPLLWIGVILLVFGVFMILAGNLIPPLHVLIESSDNPDDPEFVHMKTQEYNRILGMWEFTGLILFCVGGIMTAASILAPALLTNFRRNQIGEPIGVSRRFATRAFDVPGAIIPVSATIRDVHSTKLLTNHAMTL